MKTSLTTLFVCIVLAALGYGAYTQLAVPTVVHNVSPQPTHTEQMTQQPQATTTMSSTSPAIKPAATTTIPTTPTPQATKPASTVQTTKETTMTAKVHNIAVSGYAFAPGTLTVHVGDTVVWTNADQASHTITSDNGSELASDYFGKGKTVSHTFSTKGTFPYHCEPHPWMKGTIIVQ